METDVELGQMESEELEAAAQRRQSPVGHPLRAACAQAPVEQVQVSGEPGR